MAIRKHANNYSSTLNGAITAGATSLTVTSATGLPSIGAGEEYNLTLDDGQGTIEIVTVTDDSSSPTLTVTRAAEGTSAVAWATLSIIELRPTADSVDRKVDHASSASDNSVPRHDGDENALQSSNVLIDDSDNVSGMNQLDLADNKKIRLGTGNDAELYYDGTDLIINPQAVGSGNLKFSAGGVNFGDETLNKYDEGTWTPVPAGSSTPGSPSGTFTGTYTRNGNRVHLTCQLVFTDLDTMAGGLRVGGLPFSFDTSSNARSGINMGFRNNFTNDFSMTGWLGAATEVRIIRDDMDNTNVLITDLSATTNIYFDMVFKL